MKKPKLLMQLGNVFFILGVLSMRIHAVTPFWDRLKDGLTGTMYGAAIAFMLLGVRLNARRKAGLNDTHCV